MMLLHALYITLYIIVVNGFWNGLHIFMSCLLSMWTVEYVKVNDISLNHDPEPQCPVSHLSAQQPHLIILQTQRRVQGVSRGRNTEGYIFGAVNPDRGILKTEERETVLNCVTKAARQCRGLNCSHLLSCMWRRSAIISFQCYECLLRTFLKYIFLLYESLLKWS